MTGARPEVHRRFLRRGLRALAAGVAVPAVLGAALVAARTSPPHTELKESDPAADTVLEASPDAVTLTYTTDVQLARSTVTVRVAGSDGAAAAGDLAYLAGDRHDVLVLPLSEPLGPGSYTVTWTTAGPDGHRISGDFWFRVEPPASAEPREPSEAAAIEADPATPSPDAAQEGDPPQSGAPGGQGSMGTLWTFFLYAGIVLMLGGVVFRSQVLGRCAHGGASREWIGSVTAETSIFIAAPLGFLFGAAVGRLWDRTEAFFPEDVVGNLFTVATGTPWAAGWWLGLACVVLVTGGLLFRREGEVRPNGWKLITLGALLLPVVPVLSGHGWSDSPRAVSAVATYLHVVAAGGWMGGLACLLWVNARLPDRPQGEGASPGVPGLAEMVAAFSRVAQVAVAVLLVTGALKIWTHIDAASQLWTTPWGRTLLVKAGIVAGVLALGFYNWRIVRPRLERGEAGASPTRAAFVEFLLGAAAVVATSFLAAQPLS